MKQFSRVLWNGLVKNLGWGRASELVAAYMKGCGNPSRANEARTCYYIELSNRIDRDLPVVEAP